MTSSLRFLRAFSALFAVLAIVPATSQSIKFAPAVPYDSGLDPTSVAVADLNGDGTPDLVVANYCQNANCNAGAVEVLLGNGDGTFQSAVTYSTGGYYANSVAVGDVNGDGVPDLVVADWCGTVDQYGCLYQSGAVSVLLGNGDGTFQPAVIYNSGGLDAFSVAISDLKGDGRLDLVVSNTYYGGGDYNGSVGVLLGNGDGTFQPAVSYDTGGFLAASVAIGHLNGNGIPDLVVANFCADNDCYPANGEVGVLLGNGDGTFQPVVLYDSGGEGAYSVALGDMRGNGILDVVVTNRVLGGSVDVLLGNGNGTFQPAVGYTAKGWEADTYPAIGWGIDSLAIADVNGDGIPDVVAVELCQRYDHEGCVGTGQVNVMLGNGDGTFQKPIVYHSGGYYGSALAIADVNGDGRPDLVVTNACGSNCSGTEGSVAVLLNETSYASKTALTSSPNPSQVNQTVTFTATVTSTPTPPDGEVVTFYNGKTELGTGATTNGVATLATSFSKAGKYTIKSTYPGDPFRKPSKGTVKQAVNP
ncbi:MAG: FG-GAP-like repeat-containing protein [Terriglobales bacterium]